MRSGRCLYGVAARGEGDAGHLRGAQGEPLHSIALGDLQLLAGEIDGAPGLTAEALRRHDAAVRALHAAHPAFLPARFGAWAQSDTALVEALAPAAAELQAALDLVRGREQVTLRLFGAPGIGAAPGEDTPFPIAGPGTRHLARLARAEARRREAPELLPLRPALAPFVRAERVERHRLGATAIPGLFASVYQLIDRGSAEAHAATIADALARAGSERNGLRVAISGPWPAWSFAPGVLP